jgi:peptide/nickel transport system permease protein
MNGALVESPFARVAADFAQSRLALVGLATLILVLIVAIGAPYISPQNPYDLAQLDIMDSKLAPGTQAGDGMMFWLGSDDQGRDMLSAIFYGLRISLGIGTLATVCALAIGLVVGLTAAWFGGWVEAVIMRIVDLQLSFPSILIALVLLAVLGQGVDKIVIALVTVQWAYYARTVRGAALVERHKEYVEAATCLALSTPRILFRHLLPNVMPPLIVIATGTGRARNRARSDAVISGTGHADHVAFAGTLDRERLYASHVRQVLDQPLSRHRAVDYHRQHQSGRR